MYSRSVQGGKPDVWRISAVGDQMAMLTTGVTVVMAMELSPSR